MVRKLLFLILAAALAACSNSAVPPTTESSVSVPSEVSPLFRAFYTDHGGQIVIGNPISPELVENGVTVQYFQNAKFEYYPQMPEGNQVIMATLGAQFFGLKPCVPPSSVANTLYFNNCHSVDPIFRDFFESYGGVAFFGYPISERYIYQDKLVQDFERATMSWDATQPIEYQFSLLPLGSVACPNSPCWGDPNSAKAIPPVATATPAPQQVDPLEQFFKDHGATRVFGAMLAGPRVGEDGAREVVYENAIIYETLSSPEGAALRPLGMASLGGPEPRALPANGPNTAYFDKYGHNVSLAIFDFYNTYGGQTVFGNPISEWHIVGNQFIQYFENAVLTVQLQLSADQMVQMVDLGRQSLGVQPAPTPRVAAPQVLVIATEPTLDVLQDSSTEQQTVTVRTLDENGLPVAGATAHFTVHTPNGPMEFVTETDNSGFAAFSFVLTSYDPGAFMIYDVNVSYGDQAKDAMGSFVTWGNLAP